jgi:hypothetical protein
MHLFSRLDDCEALQENRSGAAVRSDPGVAKAMSDRLVIRGSPVWSELYRPFSVRKEPPLPPVCLKTGHEKPLDDTEALLYCDPEFDRQFGISLS